MLLITFFHILPQTLKTLLLKIMLYIPQKEKKIEKHRIERVCRTKKDELKRRLIWFQQTEHTREKKKKWPQESHTSESTHTTHDRMPSELSRQPAAI